MFERREFALTLIWEIYDDFLYKIQAYGSNEFLAGFCDENPDEFGRDDVHPIWMKKLIQHRRNKTIICVFVVDIISTGDNEHCDDGIKHVNIEASAIMIKY